MSWPQTAPSPMDPTAYAQLTRSLISSLERDPRVLGVVLLGSTAEGADVWSDHDFFVVTHPGEQEALRVDLGWLPPELEVVLVLRETAHGLQVLTADAHLLELAVFDLAELGLARVNRYRVALDRGGVAARMAEVAAVSARGVAEPPDPHHHLGQLVGCALVGASRHRRGEVTSGAHLVRALAARHLVQLVACTVPTTAAAALDDLDPLRRFERAHPVVAAELEQELRRPADDAALGLLGIAERHVRPERPDLAWQALEAVARHLEA